MKPYILSLLCFAGMQSIGAQTNLPSFWDMSNITSPPTGWTYSLLIGGTATTYTSSANYNSAPQSMRLDFTGEYLQVHFNGKPDTISYYIRHTGSSNPFSGIFELQESVDGNSWSTVHSYNNLMPIAVTKQTFRLKSTSRYARFYYAQKNSGYNVALDDVSVRPAGATSSAEIKVSAAGNAIGNGQQLRTGNATSFDIDIKNNSILSSLKIDSVAWTGSGAAYFSLSGLADSILPGATNTASILLSGAPAGSVLATLQLFSNDSSGNSLFEIPIYAISGNRATEPSAGVQNLRFTETKAWRIKLNANNSAENILVLVRAGSAVTETPTDGTIYQRGAYIGSSRIMWSGPAAEITLDKIWANSNYHVRVFSFNGYDTFVNYLTSASAAIDTTTPGLEPKNYYSGISTSDAQFVFNLRSKIRPHFQIFYSNYGGTMVENFEAYDTTNGKRVLQCYYTGYKHLYSPPIIWDTMSREHSYPYSWMGEGSQDSANYSDLHMLFPVNQDKANAVRSNFPLNNLKTVTYSFMEGRLGLDSNGNVAYEPRDEAKGVVSRACFYICAAYNRPGKPFTIPTSVPFINELQDQRVLKRWHQQFPPTNREMARHEYVAQTQGNRNPFIDNPEWACYIDFSNMSHVTSGNCFPTNSVNRYPNNVRQIVAYPNPTNNSINLDLSTFVETSGSIEVYDFSEKLVLKTSFHQKNASVDLSKLQTGSYLLVVRTKTETGLHTVIRN